MATMRDERQGLGSAVNDAAREIGAAVGIAVAGSVLAERYRHSVASRLPPLPEPLQTQVTQSAGGALQIAGALGADGERIREAAMAAFLTATHTAALVLAITAGGAAVWVAWRAPRERPSEKGSQECSTALPNRLSS